MRLLHVITALGVGGAENMLLKLLSARALAHVDQRVVAMLPGGAMAAPMRATGAMVDELNLLGGVPVVTGSVQLARLARRFQPQLIHGWLYHGNLGAALARAAAPGQPPLIWSIRQSLPTLAGENAFARAAIHLNKTLSRQPDCLLFNSHTSLEQHRAFGFDMRHARLLPNGFDTKRFAPNETDRQRLRAQWGADDADLLFGLLARHHPVKDHAGFLQAARLVLDARPQARFVMAGTGVDPSNTVLARQVSDSGLGDRVHLLGERRDVAAVLAALDVFVSASRAEAFSNAVGEAMACALPCVVTAVGDSAQVVADTGLVVPPAQPEALAAAMLRLADLGPSGRAAWGARARARIESNFSLDTVAAHHAELYRELVA
jgi:glycosyltransferase involved in cell wall biosynthesis